MFLHQSKLMCPFLTLQLTGTQPGPSWSSQRCRVLRESSQASSPSLTSPPLRDSIVPSLQESCFSFPVSLSLPVTYRPTRVNWQKSSKLVCLIYFSSSTLRSARYGNLHRRDGELPREAFWWLAFLMVLHSGLGRSAHDLFCWSVTFFVFFGLISNMCCWSHGMRVFCVAGIFYMCAYRMHECRRVAGPR